MFENVFAEMTVAAVAAGPTWLEYVAAFSGPVAGIIALGIAIFSDLRTQQRFRIQLVQEAKMDARADERQQAEWDQRSNDIRSEKEEFGGAAVDALASEVIYMTIRARDQIEGKQLSSSFNVSRPILNSLSFRFFELPEAAIDAITLCEIDFATAAEQLAKKINGDVGVGEALSDFFVLASIYISRLKADNDEPPTPEDVRKKLKIDKYVET